MTTTFCNKMAPAGRLLLAACAVCLALVSAAPLRIDGDCVSSALVRTSGVNVYPASHQIFSTTTKYAQDRTTVQIADNFEVTYYDTYKVMTAKTKKGQNETYLLYQCGTVPPSPSSLGLRDNTKTFAVPLTSVSVEDTSALAFMRLLGVMDRVSFSTEYAVDPCMQYLAGVACNRSDSNAAAALIDAKFGFSIDASDAQAVMFQATDDPGPLNRAEYIKFISTFFNKEALANTIFNQINTAYNDIKRQAEAGNGGNRPVVAWLDHMSGWGPEAVYLRFAKYRQDYTEDAGGRVLDLAALGDQYGNKVDIVADATGRNLVFYNLSLTLPVLRTILKDVDVVIDESYYLDAADATLESFRRMYGLNDTAAVTEMKFLANGRVLRLDAQAQTGTGFTSWYEQAVARPDLVLRDLVAAFNTGLLTADPPTLTAANGNGRLVRSLAATDPAAPALVSLSADNCPATEKRCETTAKPICPAVYLDCDGKVVSATDKQPCAPDCKSKGTGGNAAPRAAVITPVLLLVLVATALAAVAMSR